MMDGIEFTIGARLRSSGPKESNATMQVVVHCDLN